MIVRSFDRLPQAPCFLAGCILHFKIQRGSKIETSKEMSNTADIIDQNLPDGQGKYKWMPDRIRSNLERSWAPSTNLVLL